MRDFLLICCVLVASMAPSAATAETLDCKPCAGLSVQSPEGIAHLLSQEPALEDGAQLFVSWKVELDGSADGRAAAEVISAGATPWMALTFRTPSPLAENADALGRELEAAAALAAAAPSSTYYQIIWEPVAVGEGSPTRDYAFVLKRAAVAIAGVNPDAWVITQALPHDQAALKELYGEEVAAYIDGVALVPAEGETVGASLGLLTELDPGRPVMIDALDLPTVAADALAHAARYAASGVAATFFKIDPEKAPDLTPLKVLAHEFSGDLAYDPYSTPTGTSEAWTFVRGEDLALRVIATTDAHAERAELVFADSQLSSPKLTRMDGSEHTAYGRRTAAGLVVPVDSPESVTVLSLQRMSAAELGGFEHQLDVDAAWQMPVEEIIRRLQAFEDAQIRRIRHYEAHKAMHLRFTPGQGVATLEVTFAGDFYHRRGMGFDWVWDELYVNGVRWRGTPPELPIIQPEKAAALPFEIHFTKEYAYTLRRTAVVEGRDCWVVDFEPTGDATGDKLYRGTVWIDREIFARVKTRALQLGLVGDVISNEETVFFKPLHATGLPAPWTAESYFLPVRTVGQEVQSLLNATFPVERETQLEQIRINGPDFDDRLATAYSSEATMVRDTEAGMRYLVQADDGSRTIKEGLDFDSLSLVGGLFYEETRDYPLPLVGINYFSRNFHGSGSQINIFFAGVMVNANFAEPSLFGSKWDAGGRLFGLFIPGEEVLYRDGVEAENETVETRPARAALFLGRPLGNFLKLSFTYGLEHHAFGRADDTDEAFVVPKDTFTNSLGAELEFSRAGYSFEAEATGSSRSDWQAWGFPDSGDYDPEQADFMRWQVSAAKAWYFKSFLKLAVAAEHLDGDHLDRFSKYDFSPFSGTRVAGYQSGLVTASEANGLHLSFGFNMAEAMRVELRGDAVWASDEATGLDDELLAGVSLNGTVMGPWQTIINFDLGVPVEGPADGFTASIAFLKLWD